MATVLIIWWIGSGLVGLVVLHRLSRAPSTRDLQAVLAVGLVAVLAFGAWLGEGEVEKRQGQLREMVEGIAPTYAYELGREGHARIDLGTSPLDPVYLELIEMQRHWLAANPAVADVYTFRRLADGRIALIVDSETDYDRDGRIDDEREARTRIGEIYDEVEPQMLEALAGRPSFLGEPAVDRWGTWVSAFVPIYDEQGRVEAACGVDYHASDWLTAAQQARIAVYTRFGVFQLLFFVWLVWIARSRSDIERREQTEIELRAAVEDARAGQRAKAEFLATMSHEIRTPMNGVLGMTELLLETELDREQRQFALAIHDSGRHLLHVINQILDFSRGEAGRFELDVAPCDLRSALEESVALLSELAHRKGLELTFVERDGLADAFLTDTTRLKQIVVNLVGNAIKFTDAGEVVVELGPAAGPSAETGCQRLRVSVRDTGIGIPETQRRKVFEAFTQVDGTTTRRFEGTGLGLAICRQIVEKMGGVIGVDSVVGSGSTFWFEVTLPVVESSGVDAFEEAARLAGRRVLVVDDNATNREVVRRHLGHWRMTAGECEGGPQALEILRGSDAEGERFDAVVLDLMMPGMDGLEVARSMRADAAIAPIPIILLTSARVKESDVEGLGVTARLTKPLKRVDLYRALVDSLVGTEVGPTGQLAASASTQSASAPASEPAKMRGRGPARAKALRSLRVLVVEDNPVNQRVARAMLAKLGCEAVLADDGEAALELFDAGRFDLVLMDVMLPGMDGLEVTRRIRARRAEPALEGRGRSASDHRGDRTRGEGRS
ncbi:MAG: response regulator [Deltaproteobacteria bacterium]|nr:response regulator [Deltaproteobacteria bacterium]